jgi:uncharacterized protein YgiM (DUF1202 family)
MPPTPTPITSSAVPTVSVLWPPSGSEFVIQHEVTVHVSAADEVGVTRIELRSASAVLSSVPSPERNGQTAFQAILSWTPTRSGTQNLEVVAYRHRDASQPVPLTLYIRQRESDMIATPVPFGVSTQAGLPQPDAACQVRVDIDNLRYRSGPGTDYAILGLLDLGETLYVTGKNNSGTWWQISRNGETAWVSSDGSYSTELTSCATVPETGL